MRLGGIALCEELQRRRRGWVSPIVVLSTLVAATTRPHMRKTACFTSTDVTLRVVVKITCGVAPKSAWMSTLCYLWDGMSGVAQVQVPFLFGRRLALL